MSPCNQRGCSPKQLTLAHIAQLWGGNNSGRQKHQRHQAACGFHPGPFPPRRQDAGLLCPGLCVPTRCCIDLLVCLPSALARLAHTGIVSSTVLRDGCRAGGGELDTSHWLELSLL